MKTQKATGLAIAFIGMLVIYGITFTGCATMQQATPEQLKHEHVREYPGLTQAQIFSAATVWVAQNFKSAKDVIQHSDPSTGTLIVKGIFSKSTTYDALGALYADIDFTLTMDTKDGKARYSYTNLQAYSSDDRTRLAGVESTVGFHQAAENKFVEMETDIAKTLTEKKKDW